MLEKISVFGEVANMCHFAYMFALGVRVFGVGLSALLLMACTEALPRVIPDRDLQNYYERTSAAAEQARVYAQEARTERERTEELLAEVRELSQRVDQTRAYCAELVTKIPKPKPRRIYRIPKKTEEEIKAEKEKKEKEEGPKFSPSDAPL